MTNDDDNRPHRRDDPAAKTVELDANVLRKLVVSTVLDLGDDSGSVPVRVTPPAEDQPGEPAAPAAGDDRV